MKAKFPTGWEGPFPLYQPTYQGEWVSEKGDVIEDVAFEHALCTYRPDWLMNDTISLLRGFGELKISLLESARTKVGSRRAFRLSTVANRDMAMTNILVNAMGGISTIFIFVTLQVQGEMEQELHDLCRTRCMEMHQQDGTYHIFEGGDWLRTEFFL